MSFPEEPVFQGLPWDGAWDQTWVGSAGQEAMGNFVWKSVGGVEAGRCSWKQGTLQGTVFRNTLSPAHCSDPAPDLRFPQRLSVDPLLGGVVATLAWEESEEQRDRLLPDVES